MPDIRKRRWIERALIKGAFIYRLWRKVFRLRISLRHARNQLNRFEGVKRRELSVKDLEITRLKQIIDQQQRRFEIEVMESRDRFLDFAGSYGIRYSQTGVEDKISALKAEKYNPTKKTAYDSLSAEERELYDDHYQQHVEFCKADGRSEAEIKQLWEAAEAEELQQIRFEMGGYQ